MLKEAIQTLLETAKKPIVMADELIVPDGYSVAEPCPDPKRERATIRAQFDSAAEFIEFVKRNVTPKRATAYIDRKAFKVTITPNTWEAGENLSKWNGSSELQYRPSLTPETEALYQHFGRATVYENPGLFCEMLAIHVEPWVQSSDSADFSELTTATRKFKASRSASESSETMEIHVTKKPISISIYLCHGDNLQSKVSVIPFASVRGLGLDINRLQFALRNGFEIAADKIKTALPDYFFEQISGTEPPPPTALKTGK